MNKSKIKVGRLLLIFLAYTGLGLWNLGVVITGKLAGDETFHFIYNFVDEMSAAYSGLLLLPLLLWFFKKFPLRRNNLSTHLPLYFMASLVNAGVWIFLMHITRSLLYPLLDLGTYGYGRFFYQYLMENLKIMFLFWIIYGITSYIKTSRDREEQRVRASQLEERFTRARLQALRAQLHPHFLFNTLNAISSAMYEDIESADRMIANLSDLLRMTLTSSGGAEHELYKELELIGLYIEIMKARFGERLSVRTEVSEDTLKALMPSFILQPLVENAIKHNHQDMNVAEVIIRADKKFGKLRLSVLDNGPGITGNPYDAIKNGVGLSNTAERLEKLYGKSQAFYLSNRNNGGLKVMIEIPFHSSVGKT